MEVYQTEAVAHTLLVEEFERLKEFGAGESKLTSISPTFLPFATTGRSQFDTNTEIRLDIQFFCLACNQFQFIRFLDHNEDPLAHLLSEESEFDIALVLISIADNERVALALHSNNRMEFGFGSRLKTEVKLSSMTDNLLDHRLHLIGLNRIYYKVFSLVFIFLGSLFEAAASFLDTIVENVRESQKHRCSDVTKRQFVHHFTDVDLGVVLTRCDIDITFFINTKIGGAPTIDVVELFRVFYSPLFHSCPIRSNILVTDI